MGQQGLELWDDEQLTEDGQLIIKDGFGIMGPFTGRKIGEASTESDDKVRWVELRLYTVENDAGEVERYYLSTVGRSVVYHAMDGCRKGSPIDSSKLTDDAEPCEECEPATQADGYTPVEPRVRLERDRYSVHVCQDADAVVRKLRAPWDNNFTGPGYELLEQAMEFDPAVEAAARKSRTV